jgi:serine/threonine protein phosphatase 1
MLTYAVGDIHGCLDLLAELLGLIEADAAGRERRLVFLGDYIDRGPDSAGVIARLRGLQDAEPDRVICLKGNHEDLMLRAIRRPDVLPVWLRNGGDAALDSFGCDEPAEIPADVLAWVAACPTYWEDERRGFVHAGLRPGRDRLDQSDRDRLWIREEFLEANYDFGKLVVHGHTPRLNGRPELWPYRVNLDTGAVFGGRLTAGIFADDEVRPVGFIQVPS